MTLQKIAFLTITASLLSACGGGGGGGSTGSGGGGGGGGVGPSLPQVQQDPPVTASIDYADLTDNSGTSTLGGAVLSAGNSVSATSGTITHSSQSFTADGVSGTQSLTNSSDFDLSGFTFATDVEIDSSTIALVGVSTLADDIRDSGSAAYTGTFAAQLVDGPSLTVDTLNWDADIQVDFSGNGDVDMTFQGGGSDLIDTIRIQNARISGNGFSGGTMQTLNDGVRNDITGTTADLNGAFFGYDGVLLSPAELGGALQSSDGDTDISGIFLTRIQP